MEQHCSLNYIAALKGFRPIWTFETIYRLTKLIFRINQWIFLGFVGTARVLLHQIWETPLSLGYLQPISFLFRITYWLNVVSILVLVETLRVSMHTRQVINTARLADLIIATKVRKLAHCGWLIRWVRSNCAHLLIPLHSHLLLSLLLGSLFQLNVRRNARISSPWNWIIACFHVICTCTFLVFRNAKMRRSDRPISLVVVNGVGNGGCRVGCGRLGIRLVFNRGVITHGLRLHLVFFGWRLVTLTH